MATFLGIFLFVSAATSVLLSISIFTLFVAYTSQPDLYSRRRNRPRF